MIDVKKFISDTAVTDATFDKCLREQNSLRAYYGVLAAKYELDASKQKAVFDVTEAKLYQKIRDEYAQQGVKSTEKMIESAVRMDPEWMAAKEKLFEAQTEAEVAKALVMSLVDRRDMLIQIGADRRDEMKTQMRVMEVSNNAEAARAEKLINQANNIVKNKQEDPFTF